MLSGDKDETVNHMTREYSKLIQRNYRINTTEREKSSSGDCVILEIN